MEGRSIQCLFCRCAKFCCTSYVNDVAIHSRFAVEFDYYVPFGGELIVLWEIGTLCPGERSCGKSCTTLLLMDPWHRWNPEMHIRQGSLDFQLPRDLLCDASSVLGMLIDGGVSQVHFFEKL